jgi:dTDP-4-amino-4,6-dideoxygalactose transaminase
MFPLLIEKLSPRKIDALADFVFRRTGYKLTRGYRKLIYQQPFYRNIGKLFWGAKLLRFPEYSSYSLPNAEYVVSRLLELPTSNSVTEDYAVDISRTLLQGIKRSA